MVFNQTARTLGNLGLFGVPQKLGRALGRNSACSIVPRRDFGCSRQRKRANNKRPPDRSGRPLSISGDGSFLRPLSLGFYRGQSSIECSHPCGDGGILRYSFELGRLRENGFFRFRRPLGLCLFSNLRLGGDMLRLVFDLTGRFDKVLDLARFFAFFMIFPIRFDLVQIGLQSYSSHAVGMDVSVERHAARSAV